MPSPRNCRKWKNGPDKYSILSTHAFPAHQKLLKITLSVFTRAWPFTVPIFQTVCVSFPLSILEKEIDQRIRTSGHACHAPSSHAFLIFLQLGSAFAQTGHPTPGRPGGWRVRPAGHWQIAGRRNAERDRTGTHVWIIHNRPRQFFLPGLLRGWSILGWHPDDPRAGDIPGQLGAQWTQCALDSCPLCCPEIQNQVIRCRGNEITGM